MFRTKTAGCSERKQPAGNTTAKDFQHAERQVQLVDAVMSLRMSISEHRTSHDVELTFSLWRCKSRPWPALVPHLCAIKNVVRRRSAALCV